MIAVAAAVLALWIGGFGAARALRVARAEDSAAQGPYSLRRGAADDTQRLWREFRKTRDQALRDRLILTYAPLVKYVAGRLGSGLPAHVDEGDLVSYGLLGLIGAIERYDPDRDVKFETYAIARIKGAIIDELRAMDWVPRSVRARARDIERAIAELEAKLHRAPTDEEIAAKLGIDDRGARGQPDRDLALVDRRARRAVDDLVARRRPGRADRHDRGHAGAGAAGGARADRDARRRSARRSRGCPSARSSSSRSTTTRS